MSTLALFNAVEARLKAIVESVIGAGRVDIGMYMPRTQFPRAQIYAEEVMATDVTINMRTVRHTWFFNIVIEHVSGDAKAGYEEMKRLFWEVHDTIMRNRTLDLDVLATPAVDSRLESGTTEDNRYGFRWWMRVAVRVSELSP